MATETGPDLDTAREAVENLMDDTCTVRRSGVGKGQLNRLTGVIDAPQATAVYGPGTLGFGDRELGAKCKAKPMNEAQPQDDERGQRYRGKRFYLVGVPWDAPAFAEGDEVVLTSSRRDPQIVGKPMVVREVVYSSFLVQRKLVCEHLS